MPSTKHHRFESKIARQRGEAGRTRNRVEDAATAARCPWIYPGWEEPPNLPRHYQGGTVDAAELERALARRRLATGTGRRARHG